MKKIQKQRNNGVATIELLIAFAILLINVTSVIMLVHSGQSISLDSETNQEALQKAEQQIEKVKADAKLDFNLVNPIPVSTEDIYGKNLVVEQIDLFTKKVTSFVDWQVMGNRPQQIKLTTLITNPEALEGGDTCSSVLLGDWSNPTKTEYEFGAEILEDTSSGFPITSIQTFNHKMYVTVNNDNGNNPGTFFILDIEDPEETPTVISEFDNNLAVGQGLNAVAVDGEDYAYVANAYGSNFNTCIQGVGCAQLQVIDINPSENPSLVASYKIPGVTGNSGQAIGKSIFYRDGIVYLGLAKATGPEFNIIDVGGGGTPGASPINPIKISGYELDSAVNSILVKDNYAYVASPNSQELKILDISVLSNPVLVGGFDAPGGGGNNGNGKSLYIVGNTLYFGRTQLSGNELYVLNKSNPETNLPILGSQNIQDGDDGQPPAPSNTTINGVIVRQHLAFLITNGEFQIWNISNPANISRYATPLILPPGSGNLQGTSTDCEGNYIFVGSLGSNDKGYISVITGGDEE